MAEYIERDALERVFEERYMAYRISSQFEIFPGRILVDETQTTAAMIMQSCLDSLREAPAADVAPVRHGRWIKKDGYTECSECEYWYDSAENEDDGDRSNYCPNCGTKMKGDNNRD